MFVDYDIDDNADNANNDDNTDKNDDNVDNDDNTDEKDNTDKNDDNDDKTDEKDDLVCNTRRLAPSSQRPRITHQNVFTWEENTSLSGKNPMQEGWVKRRVKQGRKVKKIFEKSWVKRKSGRWLEEEREE